MIVILERDETQRLIFDYKDTKFKLGDVFLFTPPKDKNNGFYSSKVGELFESGMIDSLQFTVIESDCLEIVFSFTLVLDGKELTENERFEITDEVDDGAIFKENASYTFVKYLSEK